MSRTAKPTFKGYTQQDWDEVSDNPELTSADFKKARSGTEAFPELAARRRGRPKTEAPKVAVKIRVAPDVLAAYQAGGPGWQTRMHEALRKGALGLSRPSTSSSGRALRTKKSSATKVTASSDEKSSSRGKTRG